LIGTHAFGCIGNLLGVRWDGTTLGTQDVDIAASKNVSIAVLIPQPLRYGLHKLIVSQVRDVTAGAKAHTLSTATRHNKRPPLILSRAAFSPTHL